MNTEEFGQILICFQAKPYAMTAAEAEKMGIGIHRLFKLILAAGLLGGGIAAHAETWQGNLKGGGVVRVDPLTHKPTLYYNGGSTQLWDGTHEMADGSVLIVRSGVAVPDETMVSTWDWEAEPEDVDQTECCSRLVRKVCGFRDECGKTRACGLARQLDQLDKSEKRGSAVEHNAGAAVECRKSMQDEALFPACTADEDARPTPCAKLVAKVCGDKGQCSAAAACDPSRQLLVMERQERLQSKDPDFPTDSGLQCEEAMDNVFFKACAP